MNGIKMSDKELKIVDDFYNLKVMKLVEFIEENYGVYVKEGGIKRINKWVREYKLSLLVESIIAGFQQYGEVGMINDFSKIERIAYNKTKSNIDEQDIYYIRGILRKRLEYISETDALVYMRKAYKSGVEIDDIRDLSLTVDSWEEFKEAIESMGVEQK